MPEALQWFGAIFQKWRREVVEKSGTFSSCLCKHWFYKNVGFGEIYVHVRDCAKTVSLKTMEPITYYLFCALFLLYIQYTLQTIMNAMMCTNITYIHNNKQTLFRSKRLFEKFNLKSLEQQQAAKHSRIRDSKQEHRNKGTRRTEWKRDIYTQGSRWD